MSHWSSFDVTVTVNYRDILQAEKKQKSHSWSNETIKQTERKLTSSQLFRNETFHKEVKIWPADGMRKYSVQG